MNLYIQIQDGQPINHPAYEDNLMQAFNEIPSNWEPFVRVQCPIPGVYDVLESDMPTYQKVNGTWTDVWSLRPMTDAEKSAKQQSAKDLWASRPQASNWSAWTFNEATCAFDPPIPRPEPNKDKLGQNIFTFWCGAENNWKDTPPRPDGIADFDFIAWAWVNPA